MIPSTPATSAAGGSSWFGHGGIVQFVDLHAAEHSWEVSPGVAVHGYGRTQWGGDVLSGVAATNGARHTRVLG